MNMVYKSRSMSALSPCPLTNIGGMRKPIATPNYREILKPKLVIFLAFIRTKMLMQLPQEYNLQF